MCVVSRPSLKSGPSSPAAGSHPGSQFAIERLEPDGLGGGTEEVGRSRPLVAQPSTWVTLYVWDDWWGEGLGLVPPLSPATHLQGDGSLPAGEKGPTYGQCIS